jgi:hypothetical protein
VQFPFFLRNAEAGIHGLRAQTLRIFLIGFGSGLSGWSRQSVVEGQPASDFDGRQRDR